MIHPDKLKHDRGIEAFDLLKKVRLHSPRAAARCRPLTALAQAETELLVPEKRKALDETIGDARMLVLRELGLVRTLPDDDPNLVKLDPDLKERVRRKTKEILIDDELRRRRVMKMTMIAEGAEAKRVEDSIEKRKRKVEDDKRWEGTYPILCCVDSVGTARVVPGAVFSPLTSLLAVRRHKGGPRLGLAELLQGRQEEEAQDRGPRVSQDLGGAWIACTRRGRRRE